MKIQLAHKFEDIVSLENLLKAWKEFLNGKRNKKDVQEFSMRLMDNIFSLRDDLIHHTYKHGSYQAFKINDPKSRDIHKAEVRDRLLHHAIYRIFYQFFNRTFIADSYSCQMRKGTHKAINRFRSFVYQTSKNNTKTCWVLKCDIRKFFSNIDHDILMNILCEYIPDEKIRWLLEEIIKSFYSFRPGVGLPLGNLTSQLFVNIYMNEFDLFIKHKLKVHYYIRYTDDFVILSENRKWLKSKIPLIQEFLEGKLKLELHSEKIYIKTISSGVDFLGYVTLSHYRVLRTKTKRRILRKIKEKYNDLQGGMISEKFFNQSLQSYLGILSHCCGYKIEKKILSKLA